MGMKMKPFSLLYIDINGDITESLRFAHSRKQLAETITQVDSEISTVIILDGDYGIYWAQHSTVLVPKGGDNDRD